MRLFVEVCLGAHARALGARSPPCAMTACARDLSPLTQMHTIHSGAAHTPPSAAAAAVQGAAAAARHLGSLPSQPPPLRRRCRGCNAANAPSPSATLRKSAGRRRQILASARPPRAAPLVGLLIIAFALIGSAATRHVLYTIYTRHAIFEVSRTRTACSEAAVSARGGGERAVAAAKRARRGRPEGRPARPHRPRSGARGTSRAKSPEVAPTHAGRGR